MVIPAAGGVIIITLADLALAIILFVALSFVASSIAWLMIRAKQGAGSIPFAGGAIVAGVNLLWGASELMYFGLEGMARQQLWWMHHQMRLVLHYFLASNFWGIWNSIGDLGIRQFYWTLRVMDVEANFNRAWALANAVAAQIDYVLHVRVEALEGNFNRLRDLTSELVARLDYLLNGRIAPLESNFNNLRDLTSELVARTAGLEAFLPLLRTLARFETETVGGIDRLGARVGELERAEADLVRDLAKVLPLSVIAALGAVAVQELAETATNPCRCLDLDTFTDLGDRVSALEIAVG